MSKYAFRWGNCVTIYNTIIMAFNLFDTIGKKIFEAEETFKWAGEAELRIDSMRQDLKNKGLDDSRIENIVNIAKKKDPSLAQEKTFLGRAASAIWERFKTTEESLVTEKTGAEKVLSATKDVISLPFDILGAAAAPAIWKIWEALPDWVKKLWSEGAKEYAEFRQSNPRLAQNIEAVTGIVTAVIPTTAISKVTWKVAKWAITAPTKIIQTTGEVTEEAWKRLYKTAITPTANEAELLLRAKAWLGKEPITRAETALKKWIIGTETGIWVKSLKEADKIFKETVNPAMEKSTAMHDIDDLFTRVESKIMEEWSALRKKELQEGLQALKDDYLATGKKQFSTKDIQAEKSSLDEFTPSKLFQWKEVSSGYNQVKNTLANIFREQVYEDLAKTGVKNAKEMYRDYANLVDLHKIGITWITSGKLKGGTGGFISWLWDMAVTPTATAWGLFLYKVWKWLQQATFRAPKGIKTLWEYINKKWFTIKDGILVRTGVQGGITSNQEKQWSSQ